MESINNSPANIAIDKKIYRLFEKTSFSA
jgi:hypothetical protein